MRHRNRILTLVILLPSSFLTTAPARAIPATWTDGDGSYGDPASGIWSAPAIPCNELGGTWQVTIPDTGTAVSTGDGTPASGHDVTVRIPPATPLTCTVDTFTLGANAALSVPSGSSYTVNTQADILGVIEGAGGTFDSIGDSFTGDRSRATASNGGIVHLPTTVYAPTELRRSDGFSSRITTYTWNLLTASDSPSFLDLSSMQSVDDGFPQTGNDTNLHEITVSGGAVIDLSKLAIVTSPQGLDDHLRFNLTGAESSLKLDALATVASAGQGPTRFNVSGGKLSLPSLVSVADAEFTVAGAGRILDGPSPFPYSSLNRRTDDGFSSRFTTYPWNLLTASDPLSLLDLSSMQSLDAGFPQTGNDANRHEVVASGGATIDLSGLQTIRCPQGGNDWIRFTANDGSRIDLSSLRELAPAGSGWAIFRSLGSGKIDADMTVLALGCRSAIQLAGTSMMNFGELDPAQELDITLSDTSTLVTEDLFLDTSGSSITLNGAGTTLDVTGDLEIASNASITSQVEAAVIEVGGDFFFSNTDEVNGLALGGTVVHFDGAPRQLLEVGGYDIGPIPPTANDNFGFGQLVVGRPGQRTQVRLVDRIDNGNRQSCEGFETLYLLGIGTEDGLVINPGSMLIINHINVYARVGGVLTHLNSLFGEGVSQIDFGAGKLARSLVDTDADGVLDPADNCWQLPNADQLDVDCNRVGNACECGDCDLNGVVNTLDARIAQRCDVGGISPCPARCDVTNDARVTTFDARLIQRKDIGDLSVDALVCAERSEPIAPDPPLPLQ